MATWQFTISDLLLVGAITSASIAGCIVNTGFTLVLVLVTLCSLIVTVHDGSQRRIVLYSTIVGLFIVAVSIQVYSTYTLGGPVAPPRISFFSPIIYPTDIREWTADDMMRQCLFPIGGGIGVAVGYLLSRRKMTMAKNAG